MKMHRFYFVYEGQIFRRTQPLKFRLFNFSNPDYNFRKNAFHKPSLEQTALVAPR